LQIFKKQNLASTEIVRVQSAKFSVPYPEERSRDVVLVWRTIDLGCWEFGMGRDWGGFGGKGRSVHEQPGAKVMGSHHTK
jgi:hypothetical protein